MAVLSFQHELRRGAEGDAGPLDFHPGAVAGDEQAVVPEPDAALGLDDVLGLAVDDLLALELPRPLLDRDVAGESGHALLDDLRLVCGQVNRLRVGAGLGRLLGRSVRHLESGSALRPFVLRTGCGSREQDRCRECDRKKAGRWSHLVSANNV